MIALGQHWEFIAAAYIGTLVITAAIILWTASSARAAKTRLSELEAARQPARAKP